ncbi:hypothetical protein Tco_1510297, partial [Tanacetum coccineum]
MFHRLLILLQIVQLILFIVDSGCTKHMTGNLKLLCNFVEKYLGTVRFRNDQFALILGYGDLVQGNIMINKDYYIEGLNHYLFSVGQFYDADLEVAFRKSTCFVRDLQGNHLLIGTDNARIIRKRSKPDKHEHGNGKSAQEPGDMVLPTNNGSTKDVQPPVIQVQSQVPNSEPVVASGSAPMPNPKPSIPYPSRRNDERRRKKANDQIEKFYE